MLTSLFVKNFAIIDDLSVEFYEQMTALTGESGAGKSIILSALGLALGVRADKEMIQADCDSAQIIAEFTITDSKILTFLQNYELAEENNCTLRRIISSDGRSRAFINDIPTSLNTLQQLSQLLINISSQNQHQRLLNTAHQLQILDNYAQNDDLLQQLQTLVTDLNEVQQAITNIKQNNNHNQARLEFLVFAQEELEAENLSQEELDTIEDRHKQNTHLEKILTTITNVIQHIENGEKSINNADDSLSEITNLDKKLNEPYQLLEGAKINLTEVNYLLSNYLSSYENTDTTENLEQKLSKLYDLTRKHNCTLTDLLDKYNEIVAEINTIQNADITLDDLQQKEQQLIKDYQTISEKISHNRQKNAQELNQKVTHTLQELGMNGSEFVINIEHKTGFSASANDKIEFLINTGSGALRPLKKIASGGELSRISLAIAVITTSSAYAPTLVFDEVDAGISGKTAQIVANKLKKLAQNYQVLCITHLPQVAAIANKHIYIDKQDGTTTLNYLTTQKREQEIARMLGGSVNDNSLNLAKEMLQK
jgi:DNA repair protein RecN (Recombination protein N)